MLNVLNKFRVCEPATKAREELNFLANYTSGRAIDYTDNSSFVFSGTVNEFLYDGITFNPAYPVDRYGLQEVFDYPSVGIRRKEMGWSTSSFPILINATNNGGFNLFGTVIGFKKISDATSLNISISSSFSIEGSITSYNSSSGAFTFTYTSLPAVYNETNSSGDKLFNLEAEIAWAVSAIDTSVSGKTVINTPYNSNITSLEKYKEINATVSSFNTGPKTIVGTMTTGLSSLVTDSMNTIAPRNQKLRIIPMGFFNTINNALGVPVATTLNAMPTKDSLGLSSTVYYGIPYQTGSTYANTSKDYAVRAPTFNIDFQGSATIFLVTIVMEKTAVDRTNPSGFKIRLAL